MANELITLVSYTYNTESYILVAKLEAEGIKCFIKNENLVSQQQFLSNAVGGIDVQVEEKDLVKAQIILKTLEEQTKSANEVPNELGKEYEKVLIYCPKCESTNVFRKKSSLFSFGAKEHACGDCKNKWKE